jgi:hypothetical protein
MGGLQKEAPATYVLAHSHKFTGRSCRRKSKADWELEVKSAVSAFFEVPWIRIVPVHATIL